MQTRITIPWIPPLRVCYPTSTRLLDYKRRVVDRILPKFWNLANWQDLLVETEILLHPPDRKKRNMVPVEEVVCRVLSGDPLRITDRPVNFKYLSVWPSEGIIELVLTLDLKKEKEERREDADK